MTFEQWITKWLASKLQREIFPIITEEQIAVRLNDAQDVDRWRKDSSFEIVIQGKGKETIANLTQAVENVLPLMRKENYITSAILQTTQAEVSGLPKSSWKYTISVMIRHRRRPSWQV